MKTVICLEGCHGVGKTSIIELLRDRGYCILDENFVPSTAVPPQSMISELLWTANWIQAVLACPQELIIVDRSFYSAIPYANGGETLGPVMDVIRAELKNVCDIVTVHITASASTILGRVTERLNDEEWRIAMREDDLTHINRVLHYYNSAGWDYVVENDNSYADDSLTSSWGIKVVAEAVENIIRACAFRNGVILNV